MVFGGPAKVLAVECSALENRGRTSKNNSPLGSFERLDFYRTTFIE